MNALLCWLAIQPQKLTADILVSSHILKAVPLRTCKLFRGPCYFDKLNHCLPVLYR